MSKDPAHAIEHVIKRLKRDGKITKDEAVQLSEKGCEVCNQTRQRRIVHGARHWEDDYRSRHRCKVMAEKPRSKRSHRRT